MPLAATDTDEVRRAARPLAGGLDDHDELLDRLDGVRLVLLGEASHGTHEFYQERALITRRLIAEKGFHGVAAEADWPDAYRVNRYVRGRGSDGDAAEALGGFQRFPTWMWRNADVLDFVGWLRDHNERAGPASAAGFYGLDLYSLYSSMSEVVTYLDRVDPSAAARARARYSCFDTFEESGEAYGLAASGSWMGSCEKEVVAQLTELQRRGSELILPDGQAAQDELFYTEQNARVALRAEEYYRRMFAGRVESWNLRDRHMMETLEALLAHLDRQVGRAKLVVWAHNSHLGDARATELGDMGELNLGQLVRERFGGDSFLVGFSTHDGTVTAASEWDGPAELKQVRPALPGSYEALFHATGVPRFLLPLGDDTGARARLEADRLERAIGVIYLPHSERVSHYFHARLSHQFDAILHFDRTRAVEPLERTAAHGPPLEPAETYPSAL
jgi:erythromycin esterase-like protein